MADVFIRYARSNRQIAEAISRRLSASGGISTFFDDESVRPGDDLHTQLEQHIRDSLFTIVLWSEEAARSLFVREEIRVALDAWENDRLLLVRLDSSELPLGLRDIFFHDYSGVRPGEVVDSIVSYVLEILLPKKIFPPQDSQEPYAPLPPPPSSKHAHLPQSAGARGISLFRRKYSIAIWLALLALLGLGTYYKHAKYAHWDHAQYAPLAPWEEPSETSPRAALLLIGTIATILILLAIVGGIIILFKKRRRALVYTPTPREDSHRHDDFGSPSTDILFISYSRDDRPKIDVIVNRLERSGLKIWLDTRREADAQHFARSIVQAIRASKACAFMCSPTAYSSDHVVRELYLADKYGKPMIPVEIETCTPSEDFEYFFSGLEFVPYKPVDRCVQVIIHRLQSGQVARDIGA